MTTNWHDFFTHTDVIESAPRLLGATLAHGNLRARIVEVEAYRGADDPGCHAFYGRTPRTDIMFGTAGTAYVYFTYGCHWMLNLVCGPVDEAAAILLRAATPIEGLETMRERRPKARAERDLLNGPGKLAAAFGVDRTCYGVDLLCPDSALRLELSPRCVRSVLSGPRIGLAVGKGDQLPWRFADGEALEWVSNPKSGLS